MVVGDTEHPEHPERPEHLGYVRQALDKTPRRKNKPRHARDGRMIGCSGLHRHRVFYLLPHARGSDSDSEDVCR
ncbi:DUF6009 family protein [Streptomyces anulatus]